MHHPVILALPVLMLLDYLLTILGVTAALGVYRQHFTTPHYELNPRLQKSVQQRRWINPRFVISACIFTAFVILLDRIWALDPMIMGVFLGIYGAVFGRHLNSLLYFHYLNRHPAEIEGHVYFTHQLILNRSLIDILGLLPLLGLIAVLVPQPEVIGAILGIMVMAFRHLMWARKTKAHDVTALELAEAVAHSEAVHADDVEQVPRAHARVLPPTLLTILAFVVGILGAATLFCLLMSR